MFERDVAPDAIKGLCITLMVFGHITYVGGATELLTLIKAFIYTFHMPIFFILSGFFFSFNSELDIRTKKLFRRLVVPYVAFISLYLMGLIAANYFGFQTTNTGPTDLIKFIETIIIHPIGGYWFLHSLIIMQLLALLASYLANDVFCTESGVGLFLVFLLCFLWGAAELNLIEFRSILYFVLGLTIKRICKNGFYFSVIPLLFLIVTFFTIDALGENRIYSTFSPTEVLWNILLLAFLWSVLHNNKNFISRNLAWIGRNTLIILVLHALFIVLMKPLSSYFLVVEHSGIFYVLAVTFITVTGCMACAKLLDRLNLSNSFFGVAKVFSEKS